MLVTRRGRPVARLSAAEDRDPLAEFSERGLVRLPRKPTLGPPGEGEGRRTGFRSRRRAAPLTLYFDTSALIKLIGEDAVTLVTWDGDLAEGALDVGLPVVAT